MKRRTTLIAGALLACAPLLAQAAPDEASLRDAMGAYERAWNQRDVAAWTALTTAACTTRKRTCTPMKRGR